MLVNKLKKKNKLDNYTVLPNVRINCKTAKIVFDLSESKKRQQEDFKKLTSKLFAMESSSNSNKVLDFSAFFEWLMLKLLRETECKSLNTQGKLEHFFQRQINKGFSENSFHFDNKTGIIIYIFLEILAWMHTTNNVFSSLECG